jgi:hypothetical protein
LGLFDDFFFFEVVEYALDVFNFELNGAKAELKICCGDDLTIAELGATDK